MQQQFLDKRYYHRLRGRAESPLHWLAAGRRWLVVGIMLGALGCIAPLPYHPDDRLIAELGLHAAQQRLRETLLRVVSPGIRAVDVSEEAVSYPWPPGQGTRVVFAQLTAVDIYPNHVAIMYGPGRQVLGTVVCVNEVETKQLADLLMSFRVRALQASGTVPPAPPALMPTPALVPSPPAAAIAFPEEIALERVGNVYALPIEVNGELTVHFVVDPQATEVSIAPALAGNFYRTGLIAEADFLPGPAYRLLGGGTLPSERFVFRSLKIGRQSLPNVMARVRQGTASFVLGQDVLDRLGDWRVDAQRQVLIVEGQAGRSVR